MQKHSTTERETLFPLEPIEELERNMPRKLSRLRQKLGSKAKQEPDFRRKHRALDKPQLIDYRKAGCGKTARPV